MIISSNNHSDAELMISLSARDAGDGIHLRQLERRRRSRRHGSVQRRKHDVMLV